MAANSTHSIFAQPLDRRSPASQTSSPGMHCITIVAHAVLVAIRNANTSSCEETCQPAFGSPPPTNLSPFLDQCRFSGNWRLIGDVVFAGLPCVCDRERQSDICRVDVLASRQPHCP